MVVHLFSPRRPAGCPRFFSNISAACKKKTIYHSRLAHETAVTNHLSRPAGCPPTCQLVVHQKFFRYDQKTWTTSWLGGGQPAGLQICVCRPQITIIVTSTKHYENRYFVPTHKKINYNIHKMFAVFFNPSVKKTPQSDRWTTSWPAPFFVTFPLVWFLCFFVLFFFVSFAFVFICSKVYG